MIWHNAQKDTSLVTVYFGNVEKQVRNLYLSLLILFSYSYFKIMKGLG